MARFLEYIPGTSFLHRMNPLAKLACALLISIACFCSTNIIFLFCILVLDFALAATCKMTRQAAGLAKAVAIFSIILALIALLTTPKGTLLVALPWGYIGTESLLAALIIIMRLIACAIPLFLVLYITKLGDIANACCKVLHVPYKYAFTFTSAVHFIPVFMNDMKGIMEAQTARGVEFDSDSIGSQDKQRCNRCRGARLQSTHTRERLQGISLLEQRCAGNGALPRLDRPRFSDQYVPRALLNYMRRSSSLWNRGSVTYDTRSKNPQADNLSVPGCADARNVVGLLERLVRLEESST